MLATSGPEGRSIFWLWHFPHVCPSAFYCCCCFIICRWSCSSCCCSSCSCWYHESERASERTNERGRWRWHMCIGRTYNLDLVYKYIFFGISFSLVLFLILQQFRSWYLQLFFVFFFLSQMIIMTTRSEWFYGETKETSCRFRFHGDKLSTIYMKSI